MRETKSIHHVIATWLSVALLLAQSLAHAETDALERIEWKKAPIRLELVVGQEQRIEFPAAVKVGVPASVQGLLRTQSVNGMVYLMAHAPFGSNRLMVRELDSGRIYLFDVTSTEEGGASHPLQVYVTDDQSPRKNGATSGNEVDQGQPGYIQLTRFAAQQLYAPARLVKDRPGIVQVPVTRDPVELFHGGTMEATPLVAWRASGLYITVVKLTNRTGQAQTLDPRNLRGTWLTATFQHHRLLPKGDEADTTAVYLISARPFDVSR
ncbi:MAG: TIGR03749 family integrating conjugative element protein [Candidatus Thiodiazotropha endolucinida]|nr:TIGR03749 family integrating conjugative element protein [Candidatus Thiodiazotropha taylori]MCG7953154.1 TIGR03749 family integrating conjugative element protein [Candidatus Thiodiazotropha taylori]MCG8096726.1 TIGR03749 family integrating conjugative element protein [Candidatus Thiodiazotropha endolucinida]MCW4268580.1 TIGR03749 family integrating conjugative element protein [Candidatus Thiodiazotropha endolucinida]MCW4270848.1 TIGR03749 family integrating conjugative element protein [Cand